MAGIMGPDENLLDQMIYKDQTYSVVDYESNGITIGRDFDFGLVGGFSKRRDIRDYVLDFEIIDNKLWGTKRIYHSEPVDKWERSEKVMVPYTGHFVIAIGDNLKEGITVMDFLETETACELYFVDGELSGINELDETKEDWKKAVSNGENEKKENFVQKRLQGAYNLRFGYGTAALFFSQVDFSNFITDVNEPDDPETCDDELVFSSEEEKEAYQDYLDRISAPIYGRPLVDKEKPKQHADKKKKTVKTKPQKNSVLHKFTARQYGKWGHYFIDHSKSKLGEKQAFLYSLKAARLGDERGILNVGYCFLNGIGVDPNEETALKWFKKLAYFGSRKGSILGYQLAALILDDDSSDLFDPRLCIHYWEKAASLGDSESMCSLGYAYQIGRGVKKNYGKAKYWYQKAITHGDSTALYKLGQLYEYCLDDKKSAFEWYLQAAEKDNSSAASRVAFLYESGIGVKRNPLACYKWYLKAAHLGNQFAKERLLHLYPDGTEDLDSYASGTDD